ncbi:MAG: porin family protein [Bacteroidota bacterium]
MKRLGTVCVLLFFTLIANAQKVLPKFQAGVRFGYNYASFSELKNSDLLTIDRNRFVMAGAFAQVRVLKKFGLRAELLYNPQGALVNYYDSNNVKVEAIRKLNYTDITLSAIYNFRVLKLVGVYAFAGYNYSSLSSVKDAIQQPYTNTQTITDRFEKNSSGLIGGLGIRMRISNINILPEVRYLYGLSDVEKSSGIAKNRVFTASLGVSVTL